jgi:hypothetical protein
MGDEARIVLALQNHRDARARPRQGTNINSFAIRTEHGDQLQSPRIDPTDILFDYPLVCCVNELIMERQ